MYITYISEREYDTYIYAANFLTTDLFPSCGVVWNKVLVLYICTVHLYFTFVLYIAFWHLQRKKLDIKNGCNTNNYSLLHCGMMYLYMYNTVQYI